jgi:hypothetical protein
VNTLAGHRVNGWMALEPAQYGVGVAVRSTEGEADEIELLGGNCPHGGAVVCGAG